MRHAARLRGAARWGSLLLAVLVGTPIVCWTGPAAAQSRPLMVMGQAFLGGAGDHRGTAVAVQDGFVYVAGAGPEGQTSADTTLLAKFSTASLLPSGTMPPAQPAPIWQKSWSYGAAFGVAATPSGLVSVGWSHPGAGITSDGSGGGRGEGPPCQVQS